MERLAPYWGTIRSCCRRFFQAQAAHPHPHPAFCCCPSALVWHVVPLRKFLRIVERAVCPSVDLPRAVSDDTVVFAVFHT